VTTFRGGARIRAEPQIRRYQLVRKWKGADYINGWDKLRQKGSVQAYKDAGCGGPTLYRHNEGANLAFYDGHAERMAKEKVWIPDHFYGTPQQPGMWVARLEVWESYR